MTCIKDFNSYYNMKFNRAPKLTRKVRESGPDRTPGGAGGSSRRRASSLNRTQVVPGIENPADSGGGGGPSSSNSSSSSSGSSSNSSGGSGSKRRTASAGNASKGGVGAAGAAQPSPARPASRGKAGGGSSTPNSARRPPKPRKPAGDAAGKDGKAKGGGGDDGGGFGGLGLGLSGSGIGGGGGAGGGMSIGGTGIDGGGPMRGNGRAIPAQKVDMRKELQRAVHGDGRQDYSHHDDHMRKPISGFADQYSGEMKDLAMTVSNDIYQHNPNVKWGDIIGMLPAKKVLKEAVVYPIKFPQLFRGILSPWKGLLLFGPPGTGKTMLAKAVATECATTFFNISASTIVSKWRGDSEKLVRVLFELARFHAPSTIFLDEIDSIMGTRGGAGGKGDHEGSRRMKTELLVQMDGLNKSDDLVFLLAASNLPWELDPAMLRRLEKRILIDLPTLEARQAMFQHHLPEIVQEGINGGFELRSELDYGALAEATAGYSGSDIQLVCKEAAMGKLCENPP